MSAPTAAPPSSGPIVLTRPSRLRAPVATLRGAPDGVVAVVLGILLAVVSLEAGGGLRLGPLTWVEIVLQAVGGLAGAIAILAAGAATQVENRRRAGLPALAAFALLSALTLLSILWAVDPDAAWLESSRTLAYLAVFATGIAFVQLAPNRWGGLLGAVLVCCGIVSGYALLTKVFPATFAPDETYARLRAPFDYWNAVGLMAGLAIPGCLWLGARRAGHAALNALAYPLAGVAIVTILLAYSRGSLLAAGLGAAFWFAVVPLRLRGAAVLAIAAAGALPVALWAFGSDGLTTDEATLDARTSAGHQLGVALVFMVLGLLAVGLIVGFASANRAPNQITRRRAGTAILVALALVPLAGAVALSLSQKGLGGSISSGWKQLTDPNANIGAGATNRPDRLTAVGSARARYYNEALKVARAHKLLGVGAGGYGVARLRVRTDDLDVRHAHGYLFQTIADFGALGLLASLALLAAWLAAAGRAVGFGFRGANRPGFRDRPFGPERVALLSLTSVVVVYGVHSFVDWTWFIPGPTVVATLSAAWVAGRGGRESWTGWLGDGAAGEPKAPLTTRLRTGLRSTERAVLAVASILIALVVMWATLQPLRAVDLGNDALAQLDKGKVAQARATAQHARDVDPLALNPLFELQTIETRAGNAPAARAALETAVQLQPRNPASWMQLANFELFAAKDPVAAKQALGPALYLDPRSPAAVTLFLEAARQSSGVSATASPTP